MAIKIERIVEEDLNLGIGEVDVTMPGGGTAVGHKIGPQSFHSVSFIATGGSGQTVATGATDTAEIDTEELDVAGWFDPSTFKLTPDVPGRYHIDGYVSISSFTGKVTLSIQKNGSNVVSQDVVRSSSAGQIAISALVSLDGDTDYVNLAIAYVGSGSVTVSAVRISGFITGKYDVSA